MIPGLGTAGLIAFYSLSNVSATSVYWSPEKLPMAGPSLGKAWMLLTCSQHWEHSSRGTGVLVDLVISTTPGTHSPSTQSTLTMSWNTFSSCFWKPLSFVSFLLQAQCGEEWCNADKFSVCFALSLGLCWMRAPLTRVCTSIDGRQRRRMTRGWWLR